MKVDLTVLTPEEVISHLEIYGEPKDEPILNVIKYLQEKANDAIEELGSLHIDYGDLGDKAERLKEENEELSMKLETIRDCIKELNL